MRSLLLLAVCSLIAISCKQGNEAPQNSVAHNIYLQKDSGLVYCYADSQRVVFNNDYMDGGALAMMLYAKDSSIYVIGDIVPNSDGWTVRYQLYKVDTQTLETKHIGDFAAIHFEDGGFKAATTRLTNPDAVCTADEVFAIQDNYYNYDGTFIRKGENEYSYNEMPKEYGDTLVNASGFRDTNK